MAREVAARSPDGKVGAAQLIAAGWPAPMFASPWYLVLDRLKEDEFYIRKVIQRGGAKALTIAPRIVLSTIHGAKGTEADHVILLTDLPTLARRAMEREPDAERRVWYVGVTRARRTLTLVGFNNPLF